MKSNSAQFIKLKSIRGSQSLMPRHLEISNVKNFIL